MHVGVEHEYGVRRRGRAVDFRPLLPTLALDGRRIDPGDRRAVRTRAGIVITCDGREAEVVSPPVDVTPGFTTSVERWADLGERMLLDALAPSDTVDALSTHINVGLESTVARRIGPTFAARFGVPLLLLTERPDADGLLVRPRFGRLELGVDHVAGEHRRAAVALAVGGVLACTQLDAAALPPALALPLVPAVERYGWYLDRRAPGVDLYAGGRSTPLRTADGEVTDAQRQLELAWKAVAEVLDGDDLAPLDRVVLGAPLPLERPVGRLVRRQRSTPTRPPGSVFDNLLDPRRRSGFVASAVVSSWWCTVFVLAGRRRAYAVVPTSHLGGFLDDLDAGQLDAVLNAYLAGSPRGRIARGWADGHRVGLYDEVASGSSWAPPERVATGQFRSSTSGQRTTSATPATQGRPGKPVATATAVAAGGGWRWLPVLVAVALLGVVAIGWRLVPDGSDDSVLSSPSTQPATTTAPSPTATTATATSTTTTTTTTAPPAPVTAGVRAVLNPPSTTYTVEVQGAEVATFTVTWSGINCGRVGTTSSPATFVWLHGQQHGCNHPDPEHLDATIVVVLASQERTITCRYPGAASGFVDRCEGSG